MPNPFELRGPEFLAFYVVLGVVVTAAVAALRRSGDPAPAAGGPLTDYLKIAYLRGGVDEAVRVAALALIDRELVDVVDARHLRASEDKSPGGLRPTEQRLFERCKTATLATEILKNPGVRHTATSECEAPLVNAGLLPDEAVKAGRQRLLWGALFVLSLVAVLKISIALSRGRTNVLLLVAASVGFGYIVYRIANPFRTVAGDAMLADLRTLFSALKDRAATLTMPSGNNDLALLAAVFGVGATGSEYIDRLFRTPRPAGSSSSCGSGGSCGSSSSGGSCGSSCGGGCGGGCGGCGS